MKDRLIQKITDKKGGGVANHEILIGVGRGGRDYVKLKKKLERKQKKTPKYYHIVK